MSLTLDFSWLFWLIYSPQFWIGLGVGVIGCLVGIFIYWLEAAKA